MHANVTLWRECLLLYQRRCDSHGCLRLDILKPHIALSPIIQIIYEYEKHFVTFLACNGRIIMSSWQKISPKWNTSEFFSSQCLSNTSETLTTRPPCMPLQRRQIPLSCNTTPYLTLTKLHSSTLFKVWHIVDTMFDLCNV